MAVKKGFVIAVGSWRAGNNRTGASDTNGEARAGCRLHTCRRGRLVRRWAVLAVALLVLDSVIMLEVVHVCLGFECTFALRCMAQPWANYHTPKNVLLLSSDVDSWHTHAGAGVVEGQA